MYLFAMLLTNELRLIPFASESLASNPYNNLSILQDSATESFFLNDLERRVSLPVSDLKIDSRRSGRKEGFLLLKLYRSFSLINSLSEMRAFSSFLMGLR